MYLPNNPFVTTERWEKAEKIAKFMVENKPTKRSRKTFAQKQLTKNEINYLRDIFHEYGGMVERVHLLLEELRK